MSGKLITIPEKIERIAILKKELKTKLDNETRVATELQLKYLIKGL